MAKASQPPSDTEEPSETPQQEIDRQFAEMIDADPDLASLTEPDELPGTYREGMDDTSVSPMQRPVRESKRGAFGNRSEKLDFGNRGKQSQPPKETSTGKTPSGKEPAHIYGNPRAEKKLQQKKAEDAGYDNPKQQKKAEKKTHSKRVADRTSKEMGGATSDDSRLKAASKTLSQAVEQNWAGVILSLKNNKKLRRALYGIIIVQLILLSLVAYLLFNLLANPFDFVRTVVTDKATRRFVIQGAEAVGIPGASYARELNERLGYAVPIKNNNTAFADHTLNKPEPGSIDEIVANIDWEKAQWKYGNPDSCNYRFTFVPYLNYDHKTIKLIDKVFEKSTNKEIPLDQSTAAINNCFMNTYPMFNLSTRVSTARSINKSSDAYLSYVSDKSEIEKLNTEKVDETLLKKTLSRVTSKQDEAPKTDDQKIKEFADKIYDAIEKGEDPENIDYKAVATEVGLPFPEQMNEQDPAQVAAAMCPYYKLFTEPDNYVRSLNTRHDVAVRNGLKFLSLSGSGALYKNSNKETNYTMNSISNWADSAGYSLSVDGTNKGKQANAESLHNRAYIVSPIFAMRIGNAFRAGCAFVNVSSPIPAINQVFKSVAGTVITIAFQAFKAQVTAQSAGIFETGNPNNFGLQDMLIASFRIAATGTVSGTEEGPNNFNRQSMGVEQLTSDYMRTVGGAFLTEQEQAELAIKVENNARVEQQNKSLFARLFDTKSPRSIASRIAVQNTSVESTKSYLANLVKSASTPLQNLASLSNSLNFVATGQNNTAFAAGNDTAKYFKIDLAGFSEAELKSVNLLENAKAIEQLKKDIDETDDIRIKQMRYYDQCFKKEITSPILFTRIPIDGNLSNENASDQRKYLFIKTGFNIGGEGANVVYPDVSLQNPNVDSEFFQIYTCETMMTKQNPLGMAKIDLDFAKRYRLYIYYQAQMTMLRDLGQDKPPAGFYAGSGSSSGGSGGKNPGGFIWPVGTDKTGISRCADGNPPHTYPSGGKAIDIYWTPGDGGPYPDIYAVADGEVVQAGANDGYGNSVIIKHADDLFTLYGHNQEVLVQVGAKVSQGDVIAKGDSTGHSTGNHLHFEVGDNQNNRTLNPGEWLPDKHDIKARCGVQ
jgi:hypothetical protein